MKSARDGVAVLEALAATALLAVTMAICVKLLASLSVARRELDHRAIALQQAAGTIDRVAALPWADLRDERLAELGLAAEVERAIPGSSAKLTIVDAPDFGKRVCVEITWPHAVSGAGIPLRLSTFVYPDRPQPPGASP